MAGLYNLISLDKSKILSNVELESDVVKQIGPESLVEKSKSPALEFISNKD